MPYRDTVHQEDKLQQIHKHLALIRLCNTLVQLFVVTNSLIGQYSNSSFPRVINPLHSQTKASTQSSCELTPKFTISSVK